MKLSQVILAFFLLIIAAGTVAGDEIHTGFFSNKAVAGYDTVAFFTEGEAVKGKSEFKTTYKGADWYFASRENLEEFAAEPDKYAPAYGGYCAWAVAAKNDKAPGDPRYWTIVDGKLYLNYDKSVQETWEQDIPGFIAKANRNWPELKDE